MTNRIRLGVGIFLQPLFRLSTVGLRRWCSRDASTSLTRRPSAVVGPRPLPPSAVAAFGLFARQLPRYAVGDSARTLPGLWCQVSPADPSFLRSPKQVLFAPTSHPASSMLTERDKRNPANIFAVFGTRTRHRRPCGGRQVAGLRSRRQISVQRSATAERSKGATTRRGTRHWRVPGQYRRVPARSSELVPPAGNPLGSGAAGADLSGLPRDASSFDACSWRHARPVSERQPRNSRGTAAGLPRNSRGTADERRRGDGDELRPGVAFSTERRRNPFSGVFRRFHDT